MTTSASANFTANRDAIIARALRNINEIGTGETPSATRVTECALVLNMLVKEWQADGMQLWKQRTIQITPLTAGTGSYTIGTGSTINTVAPLRIFNAWRRIVATDSDSPMTLQTKSEYDQYTNKFQEATPTLFFYNPPGAAPASNEMQGTIYLLPPPDQPFIDDQELWVTAEFPIEDFDLSTDTPDFPSYYFNALVWALSDQLAYESGLPLAERSMISKKAEMHKEKAFSLDQEEGSLMFGPNHYF